ncbi:MAG: hypothetical protein CVV60_02730 [Tenericutes bacterium HGW-Tenericutes-5]|nr:MAG: hypothetical protein CVV60_02730 [Tenericutes bacterium HGW-Tenericutes-5]
MFKKIYLILSIFFLTVLFLGCEKTTTSPTVYTTTDFDDILVTDLYPVDISYPSGDYDYSSQSAELKQTFLAAAEKYLLETMYGGVPLFSRSDFVVYSDRVNLLVDEYLPVIDYYDEFGSLNTSDNKVLMADGNYGNINEYTFRKALKQGLSNYNQYLTEYIEDEEYYKLFLDIPYDFYLNENEDGYDFIGVMFDGNPIAIESSYNMSNEQVSYKWQFNVKEDLEWFYHPNTDVSSIEDNAITASDFVNTYKTVLKNNWYPGYSNYNWWTSSYATIKGVEDYINDPTEENWSNVGIELIDDFTFEIEFTNELTMTAVKYFLSTPLMSPIHVELYEFLGEDFATSNLTIAYSGPYYIDFVDENQTMRLKKNPVYHSEELFNYTGYEVLVIPDFGSQKQSFIDGYLDYLELEYNSYEEFSQYSGLRVITGLNTFRIMINGFGNVSNQQSYFVDSSYEPEPILANNDFRKAMYFAIDRSMLENINISYNPTMYHFTDSYLIDSSFGVPYRRTEFGLNVGNGFYSDSLGYNKDYAKYLFNQALETLIADEIYHRGERIKIDLLVFDSDDQEELGNFIKESFEEVFLNEALNIRVEINVQRKDYLSLYYDHISQGNFDLSIGGISDSMIYMSNY